MSMRPALERSRPPSRRWRAPLTCLTIALIVVHAGCGTPPAARQAPGPGQAVEVTEQDGYLTGAADALIYYRVAGPRDGEDTVVVLHGATGPERSQAARIAQGTPPSPDTALSNRANELLRTLLEGTATDPVETCQEYEALGRRIAEARGEAVTFRGSTCDNPPEAVRHYYRYTAQLAPRTFGWDFTSGLEDVSAPVLVVYGARDALALPAQRAWVDAYPDACLLLVPGAGKPAFTDRPEIVFPAVTTFLKGRSRCPQPDTSIVPSPMNTTRSTPAMSAAYPTATW